MVLNLQGGKGSSLAYVEYKLIEKFGWTLQELYSQPWDKIDTFLKIMNIEGQFRNRERKKFEQKAKRYGK